MTIQPKTRIGLAGYGVVGRHVYEQIQDHHSGDYQVTRVAIQHPDKHPETHIPFTTNLFELAWDPTVDVVIEVIGGIQPAYDFIRECLRNRKPVITANKFLIAYHGAELRKLARENQVPLLYEASVGGSIPVIAALNASLRHHHIESVTGIINGSTNFILSGMKADPHRPVSGLLAEARELGFLEADPSYDLKGWDIQQKLTIIAWHAFGLEVQPGEIPAFSLMNLSDDDQFLNNHGTIKYLATIQKQDNQVSAWVIPTLLPEGHPLDGVRNEYNGIVVETRYSGTQFLAGKGAGGHPTACSVLADLFSLDDRLSAIRTDATLSIRNNRILEQVYLRLRAGALKTVTDQLKTAGYPVSVLSDEKLTVSSIPVAELATLRDHCELIVALPGEVRLPVDQSGLLHLAV